ncbi:hypothetical protein JVU11DRAFT_3194 [Chiua virens]|nr:hypothetical protein JVU11DRAFT_3194 [Chiua virens]
MDNIICVTIPEDENDDQIDPNLSMDLASARISKIVSMSPPNLLRFTPETGYDVSVGNEVRIARGPFWGYQGVVRQLHSNEACVQVVFPDGFKVSLFSFSILPT